tara:strand:- start:137 stop:307 length:171 start_codon:yes stop_codon:yes gene_type:complete
LPVAALVAVMVQNLLVVLVVVAWTQVLNLRDKQTREEEVVEGVPLALLLVLVVLVL